MLKSKAEALNEAIFRLSLPKGWNAHASINHRKKTTLSLRSPNGTWFHQDFLPNVRIRALLQWFEYTASHNAPPKAHTTVSLADQRREQDRKAQWSIE